MADIAIEEGAKVAWGIIRPFAGFLAAAAVGFVAAEAMERRGPGPTINLPLIGAWHPLGESLEAKLDDKIAAEPAKLRAATAAGIQQQTAADAPAFAKWSAALSTAQDSLKAARDAAALAVTRTDNFTNAQADQAYKLGRATCGAPNAQNSPLVVAGGPAAGGGLRPDASGDFAALFSAGAYTAPGQAAVPGGSDGGPIVGAPAT